MHSSMTDCLFWGMTSIFIPGASAWSRPHSKKFHSAPSTLILKVRVRAGNLFCLSYKLEGCVVSANSVAGLRLT